MSAAITARPYLANLAGYVPGGKLAHDGPIAMLASNENPLGPSPLAIEAMQRAASGVHIYSDPNYTRLRETLAERYGLDTLQRIVLGAGSDELIGLLMLAYAGPGDEVLHTTHAFSMYAVSARAHGATIVAAPETALTADVDALAACAGPKTKLVFLADPNNPTGTMIGLEGIKRLRDALPSQALLVIDGAYADCLPREAYEDVRAFARNREDVAVIHTFSKLYGLAAARVGWGYFPPKVADLLQTLRGPFNVNALADAAAQAALADTAHLDASVAHMLEWRARLRTRLNELGAPTPESCANFLIPQLKSPEAAQAVDAHLRSKGILVRSLAGYGLPDRLRVSVGLAADNERFLSALAEAMERTPEAVG